MHSTWKCRRFENVEFSVIIYDVLMYDKCIILYKRFYLCRSKLVSLHRKEDYIHTPITLRKVCFLMRRTGEVELSEQYTLHWNQCSNFVIQLENNTTRWGFPTQSILLPIYRYYITCWKIEQGNEYPKEDVFQQIFPIPRVNLQKRGPGKSTQQLGISSLPFCNLVKQSRY